MTQFWGSLSAFNEVRQECFLTWGSIRHLPDVQALKLNVLLNKAVTGDSQIVPWCHMTTSSVYPSVATRVLTEQIVSSTSHRMTERYWNTSRNTEQTSCNLFRYIHKETQQ